MHRSIEIFLPVSSFFSFLHRFSPWRPPHVRYYFFFIFLFFFTPRHRSIIRSCPQSLYTYVVTVNSYSNQVAAYPPGARNTVLFKLPRSDTDLVVSRHDWCFFDTPEYFISSPFPAPRPGRSIFFGLRNFGDFIMWIIRQNRPP